MPRRARAFYRDGRLWLQVLVGVDHGPVVTVFMWAGGALMGAAETIEKAIERLEEIGDELGWHGWSVQLPPGKPYYTGKRRIWRDDLTDDGECVPVHVLATVDAVGHWGQYTADAIVALHRTLDAQLAILRAGLPDPAEAFSEAGQAYHAAATILASAILGES